MDYGLTHHFTYYNDKRDLQPFNNLSYLNRYGTHGSGSVFHSLINPYYKPYNEEQHRRLYRVTNTPLFYYLYVDPNQWIISQANDHDIINHMQDPDSILIAESIIDELNSTLRIYRKEKELPLGVGFNSYYYIEEDRNYYNYMWLDALYVDNEELLENIKEHGFESETLNRRNYLKSVKIETFNQITCKENEEDCENPTDYLPKQTYDAKHFGEYEVTITPQDTNIVFVEYGSRSYESIRVLLFVDEHDQMYRCYSTFCHVPSTGIKKIIIGSNSDFVPSNSRIWLVDNEALENRYEELRKNGTYDVTIDGNRITSYVNNEEPVIMNYKIGYAPGWKVFVDGEEVETFAAHGGLLSFFLNEPGEHEILLIYETPGLKLGLILSFLSFLTLTALFVLYRYQDIIKSTINHYYKQFKNHDRNVITFIKETLKEERVQEIIRFGIIGVLATLVSFIIYQLALLIFHHNLSLTLGYLLSAVFNFIASNRFTFKTTPTVQRGFRFFIAHFANYMIQLILLNGFILIGLSKSLAIIPTYLISIPLNYFFVRKALIGSI